MKYNLEHFHSDWNKLHSDKPYNKKPSDQSIQQAVTLGRVQVGDARIIYQEANESKLLTVIVGLDNGMTNNVYRDMYRIIN